MGKNNSGTGDNPYESLEAPKKLLWIIYSVMCVCLPQLAQWLRCGPGLLTCLNQCPWQAVLLLPGRSPTVQTYYKLPLMHLLASRWTKQIKWPRLNTGIEKYTPPMELRGRGAHTFANNPKCPGSILGWRWSPGVGNGNLLDWRISWTEEPRRLQSMESQRVRHDLVTKLSDLILWQFWHY